MSFKVVAFDGGGTTGWAVFVIHDQAMLSPDYPILANVLHFAAGEFTGDLRAQVRSGVELVHAWDDAYVVLEAPYGVKYLEVLDLVRFNFGLELLLGMGQPVEYQSPSLAMSTITDDRLRDFGYWARLAGQDHARDAVRHALTWARRWKEGRNNGRHRATEGTRASA